MKKVYQRPRMEIQLFNPSAYCAACFEIACLISIDGDADDTEGKRHEQAHCGSYSKNVIRVDDTGHFTITEIQSATSTETILCELEGESANMTIDDVSADKLIYWRNGGADTHDPAVWVWELHHYGYPRISSRPNHS